MLATMSPVIDTMLIDAMPCVIRRLEPGDHDAVDAIFTDASDENIYRRFFAMSRRLAHSFVDCVCVDGAEHLALVAVVGGDLVGIIDAEQSSPDTADVSLFVADQFHRRGVGTLLLHAAVDELRTRGISRLTADVLTVNTAMLHVFQHSGLEISMRRVDSVVEVSMTVGPAGPPSNAAPHQPKTQETP